MKLFKLYSIVCLLASPVGYAVTYDFESDAVGSVPKDVRVASGKARVVKHKGIGLCLQMEGSKGVYIDLIKIPKLQDYSVSWKQVYSKSSRSGMLLRLNKRSVKEGYLVQVNLNDVRIFLKQAAGFKKLGEAKLAAAGVDTVSYYKASIMKDTITIEHSADGNSYKKVLEVKDATYKDAGFTQLTEGWGGPVGHVYYDDISFKAKPVVMSKHQLKFDEVFKRRVAAKDATALALLAKQKKAGSKLKISDTGMAELIEQWQVAEAMKDVK